VGIEVGAIHSLERDELVTRVDDRAAHRHAQLPGDVLDRGD
jgi:hypothetical protein